MGTSTLSLKLPSQLRGARSNGFLWISRRTQLLMSKWQILGGCASAMALTLQLRAADPAVLVSVASGQSQASSAAYRQDVVLSPAVSAVATSGAYQHRAGFVGQLYEVAGFTVVAAASDMNETTNLQLSGRQVLDDSTFLTVAPNSITWSVQSGPITGISLGGIATAAAVIQNTAATVRGVYLGRAANLGLNVIDSIPDNFGTYAADGIDDSWQNQYFGTNNPMAAPGADPDGDGQTNLFEFTAGLVPTDPKSKFSIRIEAVAGQPAQRRIVFSPVNAGRVYAVEQRTSFASGAWQLLSGAIQNDNGNERSITDLTSSGTTRFYQVKITK
jgi:hypothetical protein